MRVSPRLALRGERAILAALELHVRQSVDDIYQAAERNRALPPIYAAGIRYMRRDPDEVWQLPSETMARGGGDCEDLAAWRAAELRIAGEPARVVVTRSAPGVLHAVVRRAHGAIEDPSRRLGMR
jgi:hypothetical protein